MFESWTAYQKPVPAKVSWDFAPGTARIIFDAPRSIVDLTPSDVEKLGYVRPDAPKLTAADVVDLIVAEFRSTDLWDGDTLDEIIDTLRNGGHDIETTDEAKLARLVASDGAWQCTECGAFDVDPGGIPGELNEVTCESCDLAAILISDNHPHPDRVIDPRSFLAGLRARPPFVSNGANECSHCGTPTDEPQPDDCQACRL